MLRKTSNVCSRSCRERTSEQEAGSGTELFLGGASAIAAVADQIQALEIRDRGQLHAPWTVQAVVHAADTIGFDHTAFGQGKLIRFKHSDFTQFFLDKFAKRLQIDTDREADQHGVFYGSLASGLSSKSTGQLRTIAGRVRRGDKPRYRARTAHSMNDRETFMWLRNGHW